MPEVNFYPRSLTFSWAIPLIITGYNQALTNEDVPKLPNSLRAENVINTYNRNRKSSLLKSFFFSFWKYLLIQFACAVAWIFVEFLITPLLFSEFLHYIEDYSNNHESNSTACLYVCGLSLLKVASNLLLQQAQYIGRQIANRCQTIITSEVHRKLMEKKEINGEEKGKITDLMSVDAQKVSSMIGNFLYFLILIIWATQGYKTIHECLMKATDKRIEVINELLQSIRIVKLFAREGYFRTNIMEARDSELNILKDRMKKSIYMDFLWASLPFLMILPAFAWYTSKNELKASIAFAAIAVCGNLQKAFGDLPYQIICLIQAHVSISRVENFLKESDIVQNPSVQNNRIIGFINATFQWPNVSNGFILNKLNVLFPIGKLSLIHGPTGCGKSALLKALLGEMKCLDGSVHCPIDKVAYVSQTAWLQNGTIRNNILFGLEFFPRKYSEILCICDLKKDFSNFTFGDKTEIGERGVTLSDGQKQRIALARAIYSNYDIIILDDCLSEESNPNFKESEYEELPDIESSNKLIKEEAKAEGRVKFNVYMTYLKASGAFWILITLLFIFSQSIQTLQDLLIRKLTEAYDNDYQSFLPNPFLPDFITNNFTLQYLSHESKKVKFYLSIYMMFGLLKILAIEGRSIIRAFGAIKRFNKNLWGLLDRYNRPIIMNWACNQCLHIYSSFAGGLFMLIIGALIINDLFSNEIDPGFAGFTFINTIKFSNHIIQIINTFIVVETNMNSVERIEEYLKLEEENLNTEERNELWPTEGKIEVQNLKVQYPNDGSSVLRTISFCASAGEKIGIIGRTGSGKSTLVKSIFRTVNPTYGQIKIDDVDISTIGLSSLREKIAIIPQNPTLFNGTLRDNIDFSGEHPDQELWEVLRKARLIEEHTSINQEGNRNVEPLTLDTNIREGGNNLSHGQRQLVMLARAFVNKSKVMILDEATANVDLETDNEIQKTMREEFKDSTLLCIAHRLRTVINYDRILVLDSGYILESGHPYKLLDNRESKFREMCIQSKEFEDLFAIAKSNYKEEVKLKL
ncbi:7606_t:CDS:10 [Gigaspora margarita]|uniref:7606_t:CDS:1 n=1 Tax=Gigaspora margarita TaxID=4874 RepID=A0ABN7UDJ7_GIGMA|nr:7606_t:CDS:10 [Gigaspora margarita]